MAPILEIKPSEKLQSLLDEFDARGGVLDFAFYSAVDLSTEQAHYRVAHEFLNACHVANTRQRALIDYDRYPLAKNFKYRWDERELRGNRITFQEFWGSDHVAPIAINERVWSIPNVDGFKTAFFCRHMICVGPLRTTRCYSTP